MPAARVQVGDVLAGKYRVERVIGEGGMGVVVAAFHLALEQRVAVKFLRKDMAERDDAAERFRREARAVARIRSEHVARVLDVGTMEDGETYIVMEYLDGHDLAEEMKNRGTLPVAEAVDIALQVAEAVSEAHASGIVHRDLKPANVFLVNRSDGSRLAKVLDFGISKSLSMDSANNVSLTQTSTVMGSPLYMSPEQMRSARDVDGRTDVWALGVMLYEALAGAPPHSGSSLPEICTSLLQDTPRPLESLRGDVPPGLAAVVMRCLAKDRTDRWSSMRELMTALAAFAPQGNVAAVTAVSRFSSPGASAVPQRASGVDVRVSTGGGRGEPSATEAPASLTLSSQSGSNEARRARRVIFVGLFGAALLVAALVAVAFRLVLGDDSAKAAGVAVEAQKAAAAGPPSAAAAAVAPEPVSVTPAQTVPAVASVSAEPVVEAEAASAQPAASASSEAVGDKAGSAAHTKPSTAAARPSSVRVRPQEDTLEHPLPKHPAPPVTITDFDGRR